MYFCPLFSCIQTLPEGKTVGDEFLILLVCGYARSELQTFLVDELTAKVRGVYLCVRVYKRMCIYA